MKTIALVSCVGKKQLNPCAAADLYQSAWFLKARTYVEQQGWPWYILSAKYGLLPQDSIIEPYEQTLNTMPASERKAWADSVYAQILQCTEGSEKLLFFAGKRYRDHLLKRLEDAGYRVEVPLAQLGIGQQLAWFKEQLSS